MQKYDTRENTEKLSSKTKQFNNAFPNDENNNSLQSININVIIFLTQVLDFSTSSFQILVDSSSLFDGT